MPRPSREALARGWHFSRTEALIRGHSWDVADVMAVYDDQVAELWATELLAQALGRPDPFGFRGRRTGQVAR